MLRGVFSYNLSGCLMGKNCLILWLKKLRPREVMSRWSFEVLQPGRVRAWGRLTHFFESYRNLVSGVRGGKYVYLPFSR